MTKPGEGQTVTLFPEGLLSKWGFGDGDTLDDPLLDLADEMGEEGAGIRGRSYHAVLIRAVREYVLPALDQEVEVYEVSTIHNPIRASKVNGVEVDDTGDNPGVVLTPEAVEVPLDVLYEWWVATGGSDDHE